MIEDDQTTEGLRSAASTGNLTAMRDLLTTGHISKATATEVLGDAGKKIEVMRCLLEFGADANSIKLRGHEPRELLELMVHFGADLKSQGHMVLHNFADDRDMLDWLLDHGADIKRVNRGRTASDFALYPGGYDDSVKVLSNVAAKGDIELFDHLVDRGADPARSLALHYVSKCKDEEKALSMLSHLLDVHEMDIHADTDDLRDFFHDAEDAGTPLCTAIYRQNLAVVQELLSRGADPNRYGDSGHPPLSKAAGDVLNPGFPPALEPLFKAGAEPQIALECAVRERNVDAAKICLLHGADAPLGLAIAREVEEARLNDMISEPTARDERLRQKSDAMIKLLEDWGQA
ncbi:putative ankyrin repeat-containing domain superfamily [Septoria linicola]|nr:putative ankyrin repeat-containing domain superfamily [Septoria linicola]